MDIRALVIKHIPYRFPKYTVGIFFQAYNIEVQVSVVGVCPYFRPVLFTVFGQ